MAVLTAGCGPGDLELGDTVLTPAAAAASTGRVVVQGFLWSVGGIAGTDVLLCETILESYPPQCGEPSLPVADFGLERIGGLQRSGTVAWAEEVRLGGDIVDGVLQVDRIPFSAYDAAGGLAMRVVMPVVIGRGEVAWVILLTNGSPDPLELRFPTGQDADVALTNAGGELVYRWSEGRSFTQAARTLTLQPAGGRRIVLEGTLDLPPGVYTLTALLTAQPSPGPAVGPVTVG
jgi:hypothetical protein